MYKASVITVSDRAYSGDYTDRSGPAVKELLQANGYQVEESIIIPDEKKSIIETLLAQCEKDINLIITTGGTGFSKRDVIPEATREVIEREASGIAEYMRMKSAEITPHAILSRGIAGLRGDSLIINLPGSPKAATENLGFILPAIRHGLDMLSGKKE